jgi:PAS domain S-box-containing protein
MRDDEVKRALALERAENACLRILSGDDGFEDQLQRVLSTCLTATGVSRAYAFRNDDDPAGGGCMRQVRGVCAEGVEPRCGSLGLRHLPCAEGPPSLRARASYARTVSELEGPERETLEAQHVVSVLIEPVYAGDSLWGFVGFDDCETPRTWQDGEARILRSLADAVGMTVSRRQQRRDIERRVVLEHLISEVCARLAQAGTGTMDDSLNRSLEEIGIFVGADRAYLFQFRNGDARMDNTHEWCAEGIAPQISSLQDLVLDDELPWFSRQVQMGDPVHIPCVADLPPEAGRERRHFEEQGIQSLVIAPMGASGRLAGFLGFDAVRTARSWTEEDRMLLRFVGDAMAGVLHRVRTEEKLRESEAKYRHLFALSPIGVVVLDPETARPVDFNDTAHLQLGYTRDEFARLTLADIDAVESPEETRERIAQVLRGERSEFETRHRTKSGELRDVHVTAQCLGVDGHRIYHCLWRDVTLQKRTEEALREGEETSRRARVLLQSVIDGIPDIIAIQKPDHTILQYNRAGYEALGMTEEEVRGRKCYELLGRSVPHKPRGRNRTHGRGRALRAGTGSALPVSQHTGP